MCIYSANQIAVTHLCHHNHYHAAFLDVKHKFGAQVASDPRHAAARPLLDDRPVLVKQAGAVNVPERLEQIDILHPKHAVVLEPVVQLLHPVGRPLLGAV